MPDTHTPAPLGHNSPPLSEALALETAALAERATILITAASKVPEITDDVLAGKAADMARLIKDHLKAVDAAREDRKRPFLEGGRLVDGHFGAIARPLDAAARAVVAKISAYQAEIRRREDAERRSREAEARRLREAEEAARAAAAQGDIAAAIRAEQVAAQAQAAEAAAVQTSAPLTSDYGVQAVATTSYGYRVTDVAALAAWLSAQHPAALAEVLLPLLPKVAGKPTKSYQPIIPGVAIDAQTKTSIR